MECTLYVNNVLYVTRFISVMRSFERISLICNDYKFQTLFFILQKPKDVVLLRIASDRQGIFIKSLKCTTEEVLSIG